MTLKATLTSLADEHEQTSRAAYYDTALLQDNYDAAIAQRQAYFIWAVISSAIAGLSMAAAATLWGLR